MSFAGGTGTLADPYIQKYNKISVGGIEVQVPITDKEVLANSIAKFNSTDGWLLTDSKIIIDINGNISVPTGSFYKINGANIIYSDIYSAPLVHTHSANDITTGIVSTSRLGTGNIDTLKILNGASLWVDLPEVQLLAFSILNLPVNLETIVDSFSKSICYGVNWYYVAYNTNTNSSLTGNMMGSWSSNPVGDHAYDYTDVRTVDIGDVSTVLIRSYWDTNLNNINLAATVTASGWNIKVKRMKI